ncbi:MAG: ParB/RepB/Spo0J family partition protein [Andreesenia angusta]|nr:ParB/RepB/Spo0J family partition protein [Andreesenia angusta]
MDIYYIDIDRIISNENQPRKFFDEDSMLDLQESIARNGIIQPLILRKLDNGYRIVAGERRWRAAMSINMSEVPAIILDIDETKEREISIIENLQREDLSAIEEAIAFKDFLEKTKTRQEDLAKILGKSRSYISNTMRLLLLPECIIEDIQNKKINPGHARAILSVKDEQLKKELNNRIQLEKLNVREAESIAKSMNNKAKKEKKPNNFDKVEDLINLDIENKLISLLGTKVRIKNKGKNNKIIEIEYNDIRQFEDFIVNLENHLNNKEQ